MVALVTAKYSFESVVIIKGEQMFLKARKNCLNYVEWANVAHTIFNWSAELCLLVSHYVFQSITLACKKTIMGNKCLEGSLSLIMCVCVGRRKFTFMYLHHFTSITPLICPYKTCNLLFVDNCWLCLNYKL